MKSSKTNEPGPQTQPLRGGAALWQDKINRDQISSPVRREEIITEATALYARVSTADQSLDRQQEETWSYAVDDLGVDPSEIEIYEDTGTGRDTQRDGYQELMTRGR